MAPEVGTNPFDLRLPWPLVAARWGSVALLTVTAVSGIRLLEWISVPVLFAIAVIVWGRHVVFADNLNGLPRLSAEATGGDSSPLPPASVIVAVRNEQVGVEAAARSLAALEYPDVEILVVDDHSSDATPQILQRVAHESPRLRLLRAPDLPAGWAGKTHACWYGFGESNPQARWLLFTDARVVFHKRALASAVAYAEKETLGFLTSIIGYEAHGLAEESIALIQNRRLVANARAYGGGQPAVPFGLGAFLLIRRDVYAAGGGHSALPGHPLEDFMIAALAKRQGAVCSVADGSEVLSLRRYHGWTDIRTRLVRTVRLCTSDRASNLADRLGLELLLYALPVPVAVAGLVRQAVMHRVDPAALWMTGMAFLVYFAGLASPRLCSRTMCRCRPWTPFLHPLGAALEAWLLVLAIAARLRGKAINWRGRDVRSPAATAG